MALSISVVSAAELFINTESALSASVTTTRLALSTLSIYPLKSILKALRKGFRVVVKRLLLRRVPPVKLTPNTRLNRHSGVKREQSVSAALQENNGCRERGQSQKTQTKQCLQ